MAIFLSFVVICTHGVSLVSPTRRQYFAPNVKICRASCQVRGDEEGDGPVSCRHTGDFLPLSCSQNRWRWNAYLIIFVSLCVSFHSRKETCRNSPSTHSSSYWTSRETWADWETKTKIVRKITKIEMNIPQHHRQNSSPLLCLRPSGKTW